jgi:hypothetical protein
VLLARQDGPQYDRLQDFEAQVLRQPRDGGGDHPAVLVTSST